MAERLAEIARRKPSMGVFPSSHGSTSALDKEKSALPTIPSQPEVETVEAVSVRNSIEIPPPTPTKEAPMVDLEEVPAKIEAFEEAAPPSDSTQAAAVIIETPSAADDATPVAPDIERPVNGLVPSSESIESPAPEHEAIDAVPARDDEGQPDERPTPHSPKEHVENDASSEMGVAAQADEEARPSTSDVSTEVATSAPLPKVEEGSVEDDLLKEVEAVVEEDGVVGISEDVDIMDEEEASFL
jgi:hypothetical protein